MQDQSKQGGGRLKNKTDEINRKMEIRRLLLFLTFTFGLTWIVFFAYILTGNVWMADGTLSGMDQFVSLGMLLPALAMLLTRWVTKEGFAVTGEGSLLLGISFREGKWKYYVLAILLPWIYFELGNALTLLLSPRAFDPAYPTVLKMTDQEQSLIFLQPLMMMLNGVIGSFAAFGEEAGWRGYMMPKMIKLWGIKKAVVIGGIFWGIWHWPLTYVGHNFGRDYFGYPFTGFAAMCLMCIFMGMILTYVTCKSQSIWPAVFLHAVNNASPSILQYFTNVDRISGWKADSAVSSLILLLPMMGMAFVSFIKMQKNNDKEVKVG